jgi:hypothetical protein
VGDKQPFHGDARIGEQQAHICHFGLGNPPQTTLHRAPFDLETHEVALGRFLGLMDKKFAIAEADLHVQWGVTAEAAGPIYGMFGLLPENKRDK